MKFNVGILFLVAIVVLVLSGCTDQPVSKKIDGDAPTQDQKKAPTQVFKVGETVKIGETELIIKSARFVEGNQYVPPKKGKVLKLEIEGKNNGGQSWFLTDADFNLYDPSGQKLEQYFGVDDLPLSGEVNQGKSVQGKIYYDVPEVDSFELVYKPNFFTNQEIKFNIVPSN